jgi:small subunit ribosomal protein S17
MTERSSRKVYRGKVVSDKSDKTIIVEISTSKRHSLYGKKVRYSNKLTAHDEANEARIGDWVEIMETRPLSATKRFRLVRIIEKAVIV